VNKKRRRLDEDEHISESWLVPYADILTLLLALFIVLFSTSQIDQKKFDEIRSAFQSAFHGGPSIFENVSPVPNQHPLNNQLPKANVHVLSEEEKQRREETKELQELQEKMNRYIQENGLDSQLDTKLDNEQLRITIREHALFASGSAEVRAEALELARTISDLLAQYPEFEVIVAGHTDNVPIHNARYPSNFHLSTARALNFMMALLENPKLDPARFSSVGYGEYKPIADNATPEGREQNRRVEVSIVRNVQE
jgi:chemotaxis protein MotB